MSEPFNERVQSYRGDLPREVSEALSAERMIACDIETSGLDWRSEQIGTVQFYGPDVGTVIVRGLTMQPRRVIGLVEADAVSKVFHHAPFDLCFMASAWSVRARNVRCTKIASKLSRPTVLPSEHSLSALLHTHLDVTVTKGAVRTSDWTASTISDEQIQYAANDVRYLLPLLAKLRFLLHEAKRQDMFDACCEFLPTQAALEVGSFPDVFTY
jgi:ribonuclease D